MGGDSIVESGETYPKFSESFILDTLPHAITETLIWKFSSFRILNHLLQLRLHIIKWQTTECRHESSYHTRTFNKSLKSMETSLQNPNRCGWMRNISF